MAKKLNLENAQDRKHLLFVNRTTEEVNRWLKWKRHNLEAMPQEELLKDRLALLKDCLKGAEKELRSKIGDTKREINAMKAELVPEIKGYQNEIEALEKTLRYDPLREVSKLVSKWPDSKKKAVAHRLGLPKL